MQKGKDYSAMGMVFPFVAGIIDRLRSYSAVLQLTSVHTTY